MKEQINIQFPTIDEMPIMDFEKTPMGYEESAIKRYKEWARNSYGSILTAIVAGEKRAIRLKAEIEERSKTEYEGRPRVNMEFAGAEGDDEKFLVFYKLTVGILKADEATRLGEVIKNFLRQ